MHGLLFAPAFMVNGLILNSHANSTSEKIGVWSAFAIWELMSAYNISRPSFGKPGDAEVLATNIALPNLCIGTLVFFFTKDNNAAKKAAFSVLPSRNGIRFSWPVKT